MFRREVIERLHNLAPKDDKPSLTLAGAKMAFGGFRKAMPAACSINHHCRTRVFDFPHARPSDEVPSLPIYDSDPVRAWIVCDLVGHYRGLDSKHYSVNPSLSYLLRQTQDKLTGQRNGQRSAFLVVDQSTELNPVQMDEECRLLDQVVYENGERTELVEGGRDGEKVILAMRTSNGRWPEIPSSESKVNMILAAVRAQADAYIEIPKHVDEVCFVTDDDQLVFPMTPKFSARAMLGPKTMRADDFQGLADQLRSALPRLDAAMQKEHIELLVNAVYWDDHKDNDFRRLHYLGLWQSLAESARILGHKYAGPPELKKHLGNDPTKLAGKDRASLAELTNHRNELAHWWTNSVGGDYMTDMYRSINELMRRKYF